MFAVIVNESDLRALEEFLGKGVRAIEDQANQDLRVAIEQLDRAYAEIAELSAEIERLRARRMPAYSGLSPRQPLARRPAPGPESARQQRSQAQTQPRAR
jgi:hypothetical protein